MHKIIEGEMEVIINGATHKLTPGQRNDVPAGVSHSVKIGDNGCMYIIAEDHVAGY